ncbi:MAG: hypothetical protein M1831_007177 [Alyxoria varia]|nr:MAG: hypothetical protein M1831_007177 [Alyxoria varia]
MATPGPPPLDTENVQGDILAGLSKKTQTFLFFQIKETHATDFRKQLNQLIPLITTTTQAVSDRQKIIEERRNGLVKVSAVNITFSNKGLKLLGIEDDIGDAAFNEGMLAGAQALGDSGKLVDNNFDPEWEPAFKKDIHGSVNIAADCEATVSHTLKDIEAIFEVGNPTSSIKETLKLSGKTRPGKESGHEHFGFLDGISQPGVEGVPNVPALPTTPQKPIAQGNILLGRDGDTIPRPSWALDGSFLTFRHLPQLVPEFNKFLEKNPIPVVGLPPDQGSAPIDQTPAKDDAAFLKPDKIDNFNFTFPDDQQTQTRCPFAAHVRKTNPRADLEGMGINIDNRRILRRGIQFGEEVTAEEANSGKTLEERGLLFVAYSSNIVDGFQFIQQSWANAVNFPINKPEVPGFDPIVGQANGGPRSMTGSNPNAQSVSLAFPTEWVLSRGGEYFFSPSIPALEKTFALAA